MPQLDIAGAIFWAIMLSMFIWPQIRHRLLQESRLRLIEKIQRATNSRVITMIHRQERISLFGIPFYRYIDVEDSEQVLRAIRTTPPDTPITLIIHTPGGLVLAAAQIALALKGHRAKTTVIVPHYAMSGGTLIALAADEIVMDPYAVLGPIDPQLSDSSGRPIPAVSVVKAVREKGKDKVKDETLIELDIAEKAIRQLEDLVVELTGDRLGEEAAQRLAKELVHGEWTHDYPLTPKRLKALGIPLKTGIPPEVYKLMDLYPQPQQAQPSVEYIPSPYIPRPRRAVEKR
ncbi:hypothetical protein CW700_01600 [Candidatus Bathyarchaeota archaeon]|nr:MAG: hypothetical protein CW700_01600 [Candidatus Bathyarchaeota archaeon]